MLTTEESKSAERKLALRVARKGFGIQAAIYGVVMSGLVVLNVLLITLTDASFAWVVFPALGWGIGLTFHYLQGVRRVERTITAHQDEIEHYAETTRKAA
jgi:hypothetical protein